VAYHAFFQQGQAVFGTSSGRITTPRTTPLPADFDLSPRWSPDGAQIAFVRLDALAHIARVMVVAPDGTGLREILNSTAIQPATGLNTIARLAWTEDGGAISLVFRDGQSGHEYSTGIWTVNTDGTGLTQTVPEQSPSTKDLRDWQLVDPDWSAAGRLVYQCFKKPSPTAALEQLI